MVDGDGCVRGGTKIPSGNTRLFIFIFFLSVLFVYNLCPPRGTDVIPARLSKSRHEMRARTNGV